METFRPILETLTEAFLGQWPENESLVFGLNSFLIIHYLHSASHCIYVFACSSAQPPVFHVKLTSKTQMQRLYVQYRLLSAVQHLDYIKLQLVGTGHHSRQAFLSTYTQSAEAGKELHIYIITKNCTSISFFQ